MRIVAVYALLFLTYVVVTAAGAMIATASLLPQGHRLRAWEAVVAQVAVFFLTVFPLALFGWFLVRSVPAALEVTVVWLFLGRSVLAALVVTVLWMTLVERGTLGVLYRAKKAPITKGKAWGIAAIVVASAFVIAWPLSAWLGRGW